MTAAFSRIHPRYSASVVSQLLAALSLMCAIAASVQAQTNTYVAGSGNWSPPQAWSLGHYPNRGESCVIPANASPIGDSGLECNNFTNSSGANLLITPGYLFPYGTSLINQGAITIGPGDGLSFGTPGSSATISGGGTITLAGGKLTTGNGPGEMITNVDNTINGSNGAISMAEFTNQATVNANVPGNPIQIQTTSLGLTNTGTMEASNGGTLVIEGQATVMNNAGGVIQALDRSTVQLAGYTFTGGILTTSGSGVIQNINSTFYNNITNNGNFQTIGGNYAILQGTITNNGSFTSTQGTIFVDGNVTLKGTGSVTSGSGRLLQSYCCNPASLTLQQPLSGGGSIGDNSLNFTNQSTVTANNPSANLVFGGNPPVNSGTMQASNGGTLEIQVPVNNNGATIAAQNGSTVLLDYNGTIAGGTITTSGSGVVLSGTGTLDGTLNTPTNQGLISVPSGNTLATKGTIANNGTINLGGFLELPASTILTGSGQVVMAPNSDFLSLGTGLSFTNQSNIIGAGSIGGSDPMGIINKGNITANQSTTLEIHPDSTGFTNSGTLTVNSGATMQVDTVPFNNLVNGTLTGGTYNVSGMLIFQPQGSITTNAANLTLGGASAQITNGIGGPSALAAFATNAKTGVFSLQNGEILSTSAKFTNQGKMTIGAGSGFGVGATYTQTAGTTTVDGALSAPGGFNLKKGTLFGSGMINGALTSAAAVTAGDSITAPGTLSVSAYTQNSTGSLTIPITKTSYGKLASSNGVVLAGKLLLKRAKGYAPPIGSTLNIVTGSAITGQFASPTLTINLKEHFTISYGTNAVTLTVVAGP